MRSPRISVIVPVYNVEQWLRRCLDSIKRQTYTDFECLMVDDGSTDSCGRICQQYTSDKRFLYLRKRNGGQGSARNVGIRNATGRYLAFVDSDDCVHEEFLSSLLGGIERENADFAMCGLVNFRNTPPRIALAHSWLDSIRNTAEWMMTASNTCWNKLYRRELFDGLLFPEGIKFEDFALMPQVYAKTRVIARTPDRLYFYYHRDGSTTVQRKVQTDIPLAYAALRDSAFGRADRNKLTMAHYFTRMMVGSYVWGVMQYDYKARKAEIHRLVSEGTALYGRRLLRRLARTETGKGKAAWGGLVLAGHLTAAHLYVKMYDGLYRLAKRLLRH